MDLRRSVIVDGHEDIAYNALALGRNFLSELAALRSQSPGSEGKPTVCLPELVKGNVRIVFATLFAAPCGDTLVQKLGGPCYTTPDEARAQALEQLRYYKDLERTGRVSIIRSKEELEEHLSDPETPSKKERGRRETR